MLVAGWLYSINNVPHFIHIVTAFSKLFVFYVTLTVLFSYIFITDNESVLPQGM